MNELIKPKQLNPGDKIAIVAPAGLVSKDYIEKSILIFEAWGLSVVKGENLFSEHYQFAGTDEQRLADFQEAIDSEDIKAVVCARGGYGTIRIIDKINWNNFVQNPKWVVGFSDITAIHASIQNLGIQSIHGVMPINMGVLEPRSKPIELLRTVLFEGGVSYALPASAYNVNGTEIAPVVGGNLSLLYALSSGSYGLDFENKILFIEDVGEQYYHIDRMMQSLRLSGVLDKISGLIVGGLTNMEDKKRPFGKTLEEIITHVVKDMDYPVIFNFPAGHLSNNFPVIMGATASMEVNTAGVKVSFN